MAKIASLFGDIRLILPDIPFLTPLATQIGLTCLVSQIVFTVLLHKRTTFLPSGPWNELPTFTAHQLVSFPLMIILTYYGMRDWFFSPLNDNKAAGITTISPHDRIFGQHHPVNDVPLAIGTGAIMLWDIPTGLISPPLHDPLMWAHHVGMATVALLMSGQFSHGTKIMIGAYYAPYYFGVIEFSSIFLAYVDVFHPKYRYYDEWLNDPKRESHTKMKVLKSLNDVCRAMFALSFLVLRGLYFPYVSFGYAIPDLWRAYITYDKLLPPPVGVPMWTGCFLIGMIGMFACLQAYWGVLVMRQVKKVLRGDEKKDKTKKVGNGKRD